MRTTNSPAKGPDFIGVGPEKTGTTWVDSQLRKHPDVWLPPIKELRYFWESLHFPDETGADRLKTKKSWHREQYYYYAKSRFFTYLKHPIDNFLSERDRISWDYDYLIKSHNDTWYLNTFANKQAKLAGEISPQYFFLPEEQIAYMARLLPETKVLITLRKPLDWLWSFARMNDGANYLKDTYGTMEAYIENKIEHCSFTNALNFWLSHFGKDRIGIFFYEDLRHDPWAYYTNICDFLDIAPDEAIRLSLSERVNEGRKSALPDVYRERIIEGWKDDIAALAQIVPNVPASWFEH